MKLTLLTLLALMSCTNLKRTTEQHMVAGKCEPEFQKTKLGRGQKIWQGITETSGKTASYLVTGLGYSTDFLVTYAGGTIVTIAVCSPLITMDVMAITQGSSNRAVFSEDCLNSVGSKVFKTFQTNLGHQANRGTETWRCPNIDHIAEGLIRVATCYEENGDKESAEKQRRLLSESPLFELCLSKKFKKEIHSN